MCNTSNIVPRPYSKIKDRDQRDEYNKMTATSCQQPNFFLASDFETIENIINTICVYKYWITRANSLVLQPLGRSSSLSCTAARGTFHHTCHHQNSAYRHCFLRTVHVIVLMQGSCRHGGIWLYKHCSFWTETHERLPDATKLNRTKVQRLRGSIYFLRPFICSRVHVTWHAGSTTLSPTVE